MLTSWLKPATPARRTPALEVRALEDRTVPATFYVDPTFNDPTPGGTTFQPAGFTPVTGLTYSATPDATATAFSDFATALLTAELSPGPDTVQLGRGVIPLSNPGTAIGSGTGSELPVTQTLTVQGLGAGASVVVPTSDTTFEGTADEFTALVRVGAGGNLTATGFRLDGTGLQIGAGFTVTDGATAAFTGVGLSGIVFAPAGATSGTGIVVQNASTLSFTGGSLTGYGRSGIVVFDSTAAVTGSELTGRGAGDRVNNGVEASGASTVFISGTTISGNNGTSILDGTQSAGVLAYENGADVASVQIVGSTIRDNTVGLILGLAAGDDSTIRATYSNIFNNQIGADGSLGTASPAIVAPNNYFGTPTGPFETAANPAGTGNPVQSTGKVQFQTFLTAPTPVRAVAQGATPAATDAAYLAAVTSLGVTVDPQGAALLTAVPASVSFNVTFANPVVDFDAADVVATGGGAGQTVAVTGSGAAYVVTVTGAFASGTPVTLSVIPQSVASSVDGTRNVASNTATVSIQTPTPVPPAAPARVGTTINTVGAAVLTAAPASAQFNVQFTEAVTGFDAADVVATAGGAARAVTVTGNGAAYTITVAGPFAATDTITVSVADSAALSATGGATFAGGPATISVQTPAAVPPTTPARVGTSVTPLGAAVLAAVPASVQFSVQFTESVVGFDAADVTATVAGSARAVTVSGSGSSYVVTVAGPFAAGTSIAVSVRDSAGLSATGGASFADGPATIAIQPATPVTPRTITRLFAVGAGAGGFPEVQVFGSDGLAQSRFLAYEPSFTGGVQTSTGDVNGDGVDDIVTGAGPGGGPRVRVYDGATGALLSNFFAYDPAVRSGVFVTIGDVDGDGTSEVITGAGVGAGPQVKVFDASGRELYTFFALEPSFRGGVTVAAGDLDGDGIAEIVAAAGAGGGPRVVVLNADGTSRASFFAYEQSFGGGVNVAVNPAALGGTGTIVTGPGAGRAPEVRQFDIAGVPMNATFNAYEPAFTGGVRVAVGDTNGNGVADIITGTGRTGGPRVRGFNPTDSRVTFDRFVFDGIGSDGLFVG